MNKIKAIAIFILFIFVIWFFVYTNNINYKKQIEIRDNYIDHPEGLINKDASKISSFWFTNLRSDFLWLQTIQYIWWNAMSAEYKKYLYAIIDVTTELNPYFEHPYIIAQLLLPSYNPRYENISEEESDKHTQEAIKIGKKWIQKFCTSIDSQWNLKIDNIIQQSDLRKIWSEEKYKNPCKSYKVPYYLAYIYFHYLNDPATASDYYKIASANDDSVDGAKSMAAIMAWKWWDREKSIFMFLNIAETLDNSQEQKCSIFSQELTNVSTWIFLAKQLQLNEELIKSIEDIRLANFGAFKDNEEKQISETECINFLNKANRELNLAFLDQANEQYKKDNNWESAQDWKQLLDDWYISFLPTDFQQYDDHGIKYEFNQDIWIFDYVMSY